MKKLKRILLAIILVAGPLQISACGSTNTDEPQMDIVDTAIDAGDFNTLVAALEAAGLVETLRGPGPFTVFAPTDEAFAKLPEGTVEALLDDIPTLTAILLYHVLAGDFDSNQLVTLGVVTTVEGREVTITANAEGVFINDAKVITADILATNGIIHVIDMVLIPPE